MSSENLEIKNTKETKDMSKANEELLKEKVSKMSAEQKASCLKTIQYIKMIASTNNIDISEWGLWNLFAAEDGSSFIADKKEINKIFFKHLFSLVDAKDKEEKKEKKEPEKTSAPFDEKEVFKAFKDAAERARGTIVAQKENQVNTAKRNMDSFFQQFTEQEKSYRAFQLELLSLKMMEDNADLYQKVVDGIKKVLEEGLFINPVCKDGIFYLNTKANTILRDVNKAANLDVVMDLGQLAIRLDTKNNMDLRIIPYKNNITSGGYWHPHVQTDGRVCWGEAQTMVTGHLSTLEIGNALRLAYGLINSYNPASPYRSLADFKLNNTKLDKINISSNVKHPDLLDAPKKK